MAKQLKIAMAQLNFLVGDIVGNTKKIIEAAKNARFHLGADAIVFPELAITGYPPEDLVLRPRFLDLADNAIHEIKRNVKDIDIIAGYPAETAAGLYNAVALIRNGEVAATYYKQELPNYGVFDEKRYFLSGEQTCVVEIKDIPVGLTICEDVWFPGAVARAAKAGARLIINVNASPYHMNKTRERVDVLQKRVQENPLPIVYVNLVGGQDELVFDGESFVMDASGKVCNRAPAFEEGVYLAEFNVDEVNNPQPVPAKVAQPRSEVETVYQALVLGVRDYIEKNRFPGAILGLSGGIDSALTLAIAVDAIGADRVEVVMMPSRYTSQMSLEDAKKAAQNFGVRYHELPIEPVFQAMLDLLREEFAGKEPDATEENIQARCRGMILMALSNKSRKIVLTTGNKSELAVGYATLYGDMAGGFNALKDVPKTLVYRLAEYRNTLSPAIPLRVIHRAPSAELAPDQKDSDTLPDYGELDGILELYVEQDKSIGEIVSEGYDRAVVERVIKMVDLNEYKRRQAAPGVRITKRAFGRDRRYPITSGFKSFS
ncbi:MAG: NAD+ synthase [Gammaproteobacteria bacterium]|nr:NAD+ synthase [Gammaproteobacteria bacterium]